MKILRCWCSRFKSHFLLKSIYPSLQNNIEMATLPTLCVLRQNSIYVASWGDLWWKYGLINTILMSLSMTNIMDPSELEFKSGFSQTIWNWQWCQYWYQRFYNMKTKNSRNKILPPVSIEPLAQDSNSSMLNFNWALVCKAKPLGSLYSHALLILTKSSKVQKSSGAWT